MVNLTAMGSRLLRITLPAQNATQPPTDSSRQQAIWLLSCYLILMRIWTAGTAQLPSARHDHSAGGQCAAICITSSSAVPAVASSARTLMRMKSSELPLS
jgi:hypothetical protein